MLLKIDISDIIFPENGIIYLDINNESKMPQGDVDDSTFNKSHIFIHAPSKPKNMSTIVNNSSIIIELSNKTRVIKEVNIFDVLLDTYNIKINKRFIKKKKIKNNIKAHL